jgi:hypothetical protein
MRRLALVTVITWSACVPDHGNNPGSQSGGGGGGGGMGQTDGGGSGVDANLSGRITGHVCATTDPRGGATCTTVTGSSLVITLEQTGETATVHADGSFAISGVLLDAGDHVLLTTNSDDVNFFPGALDVAVDSRGVASNVVFPIMRRDDVAVLEGSNSATVPGAGAILVVHVVTAPGTPLQGVTFNDVGAVTPFYDAGDPTVFTTQAPTGPTGTAIYFGLPAGLVTLTPHSTLKNGTFVLRTAAGTLTFATITLN